MTPVNTTLEKMRRGEVALGLNVKLTTSAEIVLVAKATDHDFLFVDMQHGLIPAEAVGQMAIAALGFGITLLVRVRNVADADAPRLLDAGAMGIVFPDVGTAEDARRAVAACRFPPRGRRSLMGRYPGFAYQPLGLKEAVPAMDRATLVVCMVETAAGVDNIESIAAVDGVDVVHIGCNDLVADLGHAGEFGHPKLAAAIERVLGACRARNVIVGIGGDQDMERRQRHIGNGVRFLTTDSDINFALAAASRHTAELRRRAAEALAATR